MNEQTYTIKHSDLVALCHEVRRTALGEGVDFNKALDEIIERHTKSTTPEQRLLDVLAGRITPREIEVVRRLLEGKTTRDIGGELGLTISTINTYMKRIFAKLGVHTRLELVALVTGRR